jgi:23S rRNA pseudouridine2605 synthase
MEQRLQKIMSAAGIASRRKSEELIQEGRVQVNRKVAVIGQKADVEKDEITVDGNKIAVEGKRRYLMLYKPRGYVTTTEDKFAKKMVVDLVKVPEKVYPVGRLDKDAEGLLLLTNDGEFANKIMHPSNEVDKTYVAKLKSPLTEEQQSKIMNGISVEGRKVSAAIRNVKGNMAEITLHEGRHKIVKRVFKEAGNYVDELTRIKVGNIEMGGLKRGEWRDLSLEEVKSVSK